MTTDDAQMAADIVLTSPGLTPIHTAIVESRRIFRRLRAYVVYRVALTVQLVGFLCIVSAVYDQTIEPFYVIVLALAHDLTIVCIAYDNQSASSAPERLEIAPLLIVSYALGLGLALSSALFYCLAAAMLPSAPILGVSSDSHIRQGYLQSLLFLQLSNSSALLIFVARTDGPALSFANHAAPPLALSALLSQLLIGFTLSRGVPTLEICRLELPDVLFVWLYDAACLLLLDLLKLALLRAPQLRSFVRPPAALPSLPPSPIKQARAA